jgi:hypothetical protein
LFLAVFFERKSTGVLAFQLVIVVAFTVAHQQFASKVKWSGENQPLLGTWHREDLTLFLFNLFIKFGTFFRESITKFFTDEETRVTMCVQWFVMTISTCIHHYYAVKSKHPLDDQFFFENMHKDVSLLVVSFIIDLCTFFRGMITDLIIRVNLQHKGNEEPAAAGTRGLMSTETRRLLD